MEEKFTTRFYGVRGSIPTPLTKPQVQTKLTDALDLLKPEDLATPESKQAFIEQLPPHIGGCIGGNSACVHVEVGGHHFVFDAGTGIRELGLNWLGTEFGKGKGSAHIFFSHTHWDHIMGLPFFTPLYIPGNQFTIGGCHKDLPERLKGQQRVQYFPVGFDIYGSEINFLDLSERNEYVIDDIKVTWREQYHPGKSYAYRIDYKGKSVIYATDAEYQDHGPDGLKAAAEFFQDADLVIFDAQYTMGDCLEKREWGHSSAFIGIKLANMARVKRMAFFHHEPTYSDKRLNDILESAQEFKDMIAPLNELELMLAIEGEEVNLL